MDRETSISISEVVDKLNKYNSSAGFEGECYMILFDDGGGSLNMLAGRHRVFEFENLDQLETFLNNPKNNRS